MLTALTGYAPSLSGAVVSHQRAPEKLTLPESDVLSSGSPVTSAAFSSTSSNSASTTSTVTAADETSSTSQPPRDGLINLSLGVLGAAALQDRWGLSGYAADNTEGTAQAEEDEQTSAADSSTQTDDNQSSPETSDAAALQEQQQLRLLVREDAAVRSHEQAHAAVGGVYAGTPQFEFERGSDGNRYAVEGEVAIDVSVISDDPKATMNKMKQVYAAALAPRDPSLADIQVASEAMRKYNEARAELLAQGRENTSPEVPNSGQGSGATTAQETSTYPMTIAKLMGIINQQQDQQDSELSLPQAVLETASED